ncbi:MAG: hypothetical protein HYY49_02560 [Ignavibacteriales bacterium]|nr:hypothetical protein [Ignavibacteriales bacterium]
MKRTLALVILFASGESLAQIPPTCAEPSSLRVPQNRAGRQMSVQSRSAFAPIAAFSRYGLDGQFRNGLMLGLEYVPNRRTNPNFEFSGGIVLGTSGSAQRYVVSNGFPVVQGDNAFTFGDRYYAVPRFGLGLAFFGVGAVYYLADGDVRPYVGIGANAYMWRNYAGTVTPDVKGGLDVNIASGFSGFAEVRHSIGMPSFFTSQYSTFDGLTSFAFGIAFAPRF